nr:MAG TPA: hypothetical protein [Caudoviricetes sp.]
MTKRNLKIFHQNVCCANLYKFLIHYYELLIVHLYYHCGVLLLSS